jgi:hypothetical protein
MHTASAACSARTGSFYNGLFWKVMDAEYFIVSDTKQNASMLKH